MRGACVPIEGGRKVGSWAGPSRLVRLECAALEADGWEMKPGLGCGLQKVLNARLALKLHPSQPEMSLPRIPASAFSRHADATAPIFAFSQPRWQHLLAHVWGQMSFQCLLSSQTGQGQAQHQAHSSGQKTWFLPAKSL